MSPDALFTELVLEVFRLNGRLLAAGDRMAAPVGLTSARWQILGALQQQHPLTVAQIGRVMGLTRQSVQRTADVLAAEGIVEYLPNPQHKRAKLVRPTAMGWAVLERIGHIQKDWAHQTAAGVRASALTEALDLLRLLRNRLELAESISEGGNLP